MEKNKEEIIKRLTSLGFIINVSTAKNLVVALNDILTELRENEIKLLLEFEIIHKRKKSGEKLSFLEESLYKHISKNYTKNK